MFFKTSQANGKSIIKREVDENDYEFIRGFLTSIDGVIFDNQALYNEIDGKGISVIGPVNQAMESLLQSNGNLNEKVWMKLHEVEHIFMEGGDFLISTVIVTLDTLQTIRGRFYCID